MHPFPIVNRDYTSFVKPSARKGFGDMKVLPWIVKRFHNRKITTKKQNKGELHACSAKEGKSHDAVMNYQLCSLGSFEQEIDKMCREDTEFRIVQNADYERILFYSALRMKLLRSLYYSHQQQFAQPGIQEMCENCISCNRCCNDMDCTL
ncbi:hypothetical protein Cni_G14924 [Canna indica]|uniref:Uncharacterized protein n=1 Tax=Canna indica TaxID=4628 RepID=A0AAQ3KIN1_9LILI|nr:hypothetical protein Cni_G14924 [Canna indica]